MGATFAGTERFEIVRALGAGGMGLVYEAYDREQRASCALKLLRRVTPRALLRFKREFRLLQGLRHPNLLTLGELFNEQEHWFFTMELVRGVDFLSYVCGEKCAERGREQTLTIEDSGPLVLERSSGEDPRATFDESRLRSVLIQLAEGLRFLHDAGKVHRDVKPSNVLVTAEGRVVILDFGLIADLELDGDANSTIGTPGYIAPEQIRGEAIGPAVDLYAAGVILHAALTGTLPATALSVPSLLLRAPARPSTIIGGVPPLLDELCLRLLDPDPESRPSADEVLILLGAKERARVAPMKTQFVGRRSELEMIVRAYEESRARPQVVVIEGPSGIGKSAFLTEALGRLRARDERPLILAGRCYEHEGIPYKAIDGVMDELGAHLENNARELGLPKDVSLLGVLFPALRRIPALVAGAEMTDARSALDMRRKAERAGRALFLALAARRRLVVAIDDFQWSDADSRTFLNALALGPDAPPFFLLLSSRTAPALAFGDGATQTIALAPLANDDACELARALLDSSGDPHAISPEAIAKEAGGHPFFMNELVWDQAARAGAHVKLEEVLAGRIAGCTGSARSVLKLVAVAAAPIAQNIIAEAVGLDAGMFARAARHLRDARLVRTIGVRLGDEIEAYHDRVRETVVAGLDADAYAELHLRLALVLEKRSPEDVDRLVTHFQNGGDQRRAAEYAIRAGDRAAGALAFDRAAAFYRLAIAGLPEAAQLHLRLADALANAGLGAEAARAYERAAEESDPATALELRRRAAEHLLRSGRVDEGLTALEAMMEKLGVRVPRTTAGAFASVLARRAHVHLRGLKYTERAPQPGAAEKKKRWGSAPNPARAEGREDSDPAMTEGREYSDRATAEGREYSDRARAEGREDSDRARTEGREYFDRAAEVVSIDAIRVDTLWGASARLGPIDTVRAADYQARHLLAALELGEPFRVARALLAEAAFVSMGGPKKREVAARLTSIAEPIVERLRDPYATAMFEFVRGFSAYQYGEYRTARVGLSLAAELFQTTCTGAFHDRAVAKRFELDCLFYLGELGELKNGVPVLLDDAERRGDLYLAAELRTGLPNSIWLAGDRPDEARRISALGIAQFPRRVFFLQHYYHALSSVQTAMYVGEYEEAFRISEQAWRRLRLSLLGTIQAVRVEALCMRARAAIAAGELSIAEKAAGLLARQRTPGARGFAIAARAGIAARRGDLRGARELLVEAERAFDLAGVGAWGAACRMYLGRSDVAAGWLSAHGVVRAERFASLLVPGFL